MNKVRMPKEFENILLDEQLREVERAELINQIKILSSWKEKSQHILDSVRMILDLAMDISMKYEPCGYYCDETVGHVNHKLFNWAREYKGKIEEILGEE